MSILTISCRIACTAAILFVALGSNAASSNVCKFANYDGGFRPIFDNYVGGKTGSSLQKFFDSLPLIASKLSLEVRS
jgi:hypothetical protein